MPLQTRVADRVASWFAQADEFRHRHPRLMQRLVQAHDADESLEEFCAAHAKAFAPFDTPAGLRLLLARAGHVGADREVHDLATFAIAEASRVQVLRAGVALRRAKTGGAPPA